MRADRLVSIMLLLQIYRRLTAAELARRLEVSERTIHRDMEALSTAGVPVTALRGTGGGWALVDGYRTNLTGLNAAEVQTLFSGLPPRLLTDLGLGREAGAAQVKLLAALPAASRADAEYARRRVHVDVAGWNGADEQVPHLHTIQEAVWRGRKLFFAYGGDCTEAAERAVDPLGLVAKGGVWYLVARAADGEVRSYRVARVTRARVSEETCERPEGFDLAAFWAGSVTRFKSGGPRFYATFRAHKSVLHLVPYAGRFSRVESIGETDAEGWANVALRFQFEEDACAFALGFGAKVELVEPAELRVKVIRMAEEVLAFYKGRGAHG
ncbi:MAG: YafY family transcriptional regulator [Acidobacteria bacterium]|nr:YafY family transcriptional regulator [Acidobacteriota bacterium]